MDSSRTQVTVGGPGTGKTTDMLRIVEEALVAGVKPNEIAYISFTKKAAEEALSRAVRRFSLPIEDFPYFRTIHSLSFRQVGLSRDRVLQWGHIKDLGNILGMEFKGKFPTDEDSVYGMNTADRMLFLEGLAKNRGVTPETVWSEAMEDDIGWHEFERFCNGLEAYKTSRGLSDFNDMVTSFVDLGPSAMPNLKCLIVDEAQDLSNLQWGAVELLARNSEQNNICGDDLQAIYEWSGANVQKFISLPGSSRSLDKSHRVPKKVFDVLGGIESRIKNKRPRKWTSRDEPGSVNWFNDVEEVDLSKGTWLILARNGYMLDDVEDLCMTQGFSFHSVNRDPLRSRSLEAIRIWEQLRSRKSSASRSDVELVLKYLDPSAVGSGFREQLKKGELSSLWTWDDMVKIGLKTDKVWHESLTRIPLIEKDFFLAARRRGEPLLKEPRIRISTIHASKGGQADHVLLLTDISQRCWDNMQEDEDTENRCWYVGASRCFQSLNLVAPRTNLYYEI